MPIDWTDISKLPGALVVGIVVTVVGGVILAWYLRLEGKALGSLNSWWPRKRLPATYVDTVALKQLAVNGSEAHLVFQGEEQRDRAEQLRAQLSRSGWNVGMNEQPREPHRWVHGLAVSGCNRGLVRGMKRALQKAGHRPVSVMVERDDPNASAAERDRQRRHVHIIVGPLPR